MTRIETRDNQQHSGIRVAVDIGGTFTDLHLQDPVSGSSATYKTPSTPEDPSIGLIEGLRGVTAKIDRSPSDISLILHGSTIATNAVLERKLPIGALITTAGFEDVLEIGRHIRQNVYTLKAEPRSLLIPRHRRFGVAERIDAQGEVRQALDENALLDIVHQLKQLKVETVALVFLHGYRNSQHEERAAAIIQQHAPELLVTCSYQTSPEIREFERTSTTVLNALLRPVISNYLSRVGEQLQDNGVTASLFLVQSNGGLASPQDAARLPAKLLLSGPAGGAMAMVSLSLRHQLPNLVGFDMGGTSSDISVVQNHVIGETPESAIDGLPVRLPMIEIRTIGAGGGSIARVDTGGLRVGPISAGAKPGPVCYQRGGTQSTVTDANLALGRIDKRAFRTGGMELNAEAATESISRDIASQLSLTSSEAASGIINIATTTMAAAIRLSLFEKGMDPVDFTLAPFGGAAGLHACSVASALGLARIVFPRDASTLSALGILQADLRYDLSDSKLLPATEASIPELAIAIDKLSQDAHKLLDANNLPQTQRRIEINCDMRYRGQAFELAVPWPELESSSPSRIALDDVALHQLVSHFHKIHEERYAYSAIEDAVEIVTVRVKAWGLLQKNAVSTTENNNPATIRQSEASTEYSSRQITLDGETIDVPCHHRLSLTPGQETLHGPLLVEEDYTVLLIEPGWQLQVLDDGDLLCERSGS